MQVLCRLSPLILLILCIGSYVHAQTAASWRIQGLDMHGLSTSGVSISIKQISYAYTYQFDDIAYSCSHVIDLYPIHQCDQAQVSFTLADQRHQFNANVFYDFSINQWAVNVSDASNRIAMAMHSEQQQIEVALNHVELSQLLNLIDLRPTWKVPEMELTGQLTIDLSDQTISSSEQLTFTGLNYEYSDDIIVADLSGQMGFVMDFELSDLRADVQLNAREMLFEQLYVDFSGFPVSVQADVTQNLTGDYQIQTELLNQQSLKIQTSFTTNLALTIQQPQFMIEVIDSHHFNQRILNSVLGIYGVGGSEMSGQFTVVANSIENPLDQWQINFNDYFFLNERRKIDAQSLDGTVHWQQMNQTPDSALTWDSMLLAGLPVGESSVLFNFSQDEVRLIGEHQFPVFDGMIELKAFEVQKLFSEFVDMQVDANVLPFLWA